MLREAAFSQGSGAIPCRRRCEGDRQSRAKEVEWEGGRVREWSVLWVEVVVAAIHDETKPCPGLQVHPLARDDAIRRMAGELFPTLSHSHTDTEAQLHLTSLDFT